MKNIAALGFNKFVKKPCSNALEKDIELTALEHSRSNAGEFLKEEIKPLAPM